MIYNKIASTLGWTEEPATAAEGLFLQPEECTAIDKALGDAESAAAKAKVDADTIAASIADLENQLSIATKKANDAEAALATAQTDLTTAQNRIVELEAKPGKEAVVPGEDKDQFADNKTDNKKYLTAYDNMFV